MKKASSIVWGIILVAVGIIVALNAFEIVDINLFFKGWWTLIIIIPCVVGIITEKEKTGNLIGILVGVLLLLFCQDIISGDMIWKAALPIIIIIIGVKMIFKGIFGNKTVEVFNRMKTEGKFPHNLTAVFSEQTLNCAGMDFDGADITAVFGSAKCDLNGALVAKKSAVNVCAVFGGITVIVPKGINVKVTSTSIFGGVSNKTEYNKDNDTTLYVSGLCLFGGVDIK